MSAIHEHAPLIVVALLILLCAETTLLSVAFRRINSKGKKKGSSKGMVSKDKYNELEALFKEEKKINQNLAAKNRKLDECKMISDKEYENLSVKYTNRLVEFDNLLSENKELKRKVGELEHLVSSGSESLVDEASHDSSNPVVASQQGEIKEDKKGDYKNNLGAKLEDINVEEKKEDVEASPSEKPIETFKEEKKEEKAKEEKPQVIDKNKEIIMYASFPRSAGNKTYFTDLTEKQVEDSYFELKISANGEKATFKPIDFMKIRSFDAAMSAVLTEGVKPNLANTVQGVEPGKAYKDGNAWFVENLAKIKLR